MGLEVDEGFRLINFAMKQDLEDKIFFRWCISYQHVPFEDFKGRLTRMSSFGKRSGDEILEEVKDILDLKFVESEGG